MTNKVEYILSLFQNPQDESAENGNDVDTDDERKFAGLVLCCENFLDAEFMNQITLKFPLPFVSMILSSENMNPEHRNLCLIVVDSLFSNYFKNRNHVITNAIVNIARELEDQLGDILDECVPTCENLRLVTSLVWNLVKTLLIDGETSNVKPQISENEEEDFQNLPPSTQKEIAHNICDSIDVLIEQVENVSNFDSKCELVSILTKLEGASDKYSSQLFSILISIIIDAQNDVDILKHALEALLILLLSEGHSSFKAEFVKNSKQFIAAYSKLFSITELKFDILSIGIFIISSATPNNDVVKRLLVLASVEVHMQLESILDAFDINDENIDLSMLTACLQVLESILAIDDDDTVDMNVFKLLQRTIKYLFEFVTDVKIVDDEESALKTKSMDLVSKTIAIYMINEPMQYASDFINSFNLKFKFFNSSLINCLPAMLIVCNPTDWVDCCINEIVDLIFTQESYVSKLAIELITNACFDFRVYLPEVIKFQTNVTSCSASSSPAVVMTKLPKLEIPIIHSICTTREDICSICNLCNRLAQEDDSSSDKVILIASLLFTITETEAFLLIPQLNDVWLKLVHLVFENFQNAIYCLSILLSDGGETRPILAQTFETILPFKCKKLNFEIFENAVAVNAWYGSCNKMYKNKAAITE